MSNSPTVMYARHELFLVEGTLSSLHHAASKTRLLETLARHMSEPRPLPDDSQYAAAMHQALAEETVMYEVSEYDTPVFIARLGGSLLFGMFDNARVLVEGDRVRAVVARPDPARGRPGAGHLYGVRFPASGILRRQRGHGVVPQPGRGVLRAERRPRPRKTQQEIRSLIASETTP